jgi:putative peptidoglycan lipid II flippase
VTSTAPSAPAAVSAKPRQSLIRSSLVFSSLTLVSRVMGLARDVVVTAYMGASTTIAGDAYNTALSFPNLFRRIFAEGAFTAAFVPEYARTLEEKGEAEADRIATDAMATLAAVTVALTIAAMVFMAPLMHVINPGYVDTPKKFWLAVTLTQISMSYLPCMAIVALMSGVLNARGKFAISAVAPTLLNLCMLVAVLPQKTPESAAAAASWGVVAAGVSQVALLWWGVKRTGARIRVGVPRLTPEIRKLIGLAIPGAIAASATQINVFVSQSLSSNVDGARSWLNTADRFYQLPLGLVGVAVGVALLPALSRAVHSGDKTRAQETMDEAVNFSMALTLPAAAALIAMPFFLVDGMFTRGAFTVEDARQTASALLHYGWGVPAFVLVRILAPAFFARQDTRAPMFFALASVVVNIALGVSLFHVIGVPGLAIATSAAAWSNVLLMIFTLAKRGAWKLSGAATSRLFRIGLASAAMGAFSGACSYFRAELEPYLTVPHVEPKLTTVMAVCLVGVTLYGILLFATRAVSLSEIKGALRRKPKAEGETGPAAPVDLG